MRFNILIACIFLFRTRNSSAFSLFSSSSIIDVSHRDKLAPTFKKSFKRNNSVLRDAHVNSQSVVNFECPLLEAGYPPAVFEYETKVLCKKPLLVYLPGFDGTLLAPFLQFPELHTEFDVRGMVVDMEDRSRVEDLKDLVLAFIYKEMTVENENQIVHRPVYIMGESFGGILALEVALSIVERNKNIQRGDGSTESSSSSSSSMENVIDLQGVILINPATCYLESNLAKYGPPVTKVSPLAYPWEILKLIPLFTDEYAIPQLLLILQSKALPSIIDNAQKEAYLGRTAFNIPSKLKFMPQETLKWRLEEWLSKGCINWKEKERNLGNFDIPLLIVAGEADNTLPSVQEAHRLSDLFIKQCQSKPLVHIVQGAGHACTSGSRVDLAALMRNAFGDRLVTDGRRAMKSIASQNTGTYFGMEERYDRANVGLNPIQYWSKVNYSKVNC